MSRLLDSKMVKYHPHNGKPDLGDLFSHYAPALFSIILKMTKCEKNAEQILQLTFIRANERFGDFDPRKSSIFVWMYQIARETAHGPLVPFKIDSSSMGSVSESKFTPDKFKESPTSHCDESMTVFNLIFFEGFSVSEVSDRLELPLKAVMKMLRTAVTVLRKS